MTYITFSLPPIIPTFRAPFQPPTSCRRPRSFHPYITCTTSNSNKSKPIHQQPTTHDRNWMFFDVARVLVSGGRGGNGCVAFRREKGIPRGGPAGGSGGNGGSIYFIADSSCNTLSKFRASAAFRANDGKNGTGKGKHGENSKDIFVYVPTGCIIRNMDGIILADLSIDNMKFCAAKGGRGGRGNLAFKTEQNRAPRISELGEKGLERWLQMELKLVADVALVGFPNAGKSTILDKISNATPKIADYPFTTIVPNLGVVDGIDGANGLVIADVPGLIEGAHKGIGMGVAFLRHVERCKVVVHVIDGNEEDIVEKYKAIRMEMELFDEKLAKKKEVVLINKIDLPGVKEKWEKESMELLIKAIGKHKRIGIVSAKAGTGLKQVIRKIQKLVETIPEEDDIIVEDEKEGDGELSAIVKKIDEGIFEISGYKVRKAYDMTNWDYIEGIDRFQRILQALGVNDMLMKAGAKDGDNVICYGHDFDYFQQENIYSAAAAADGYID